MSIQQFHPHRTQRAQAALDAYQQASGEQAVHDSGRVRDLLQDLIHWLAAHQYTDPCETFQEAADTAYRGFPKELEEEDL